LSVERRHFDFVWPEWSPVGRLQFFEEKETLSGKKKWLTEISNIIIILEYIYYFRIYI